MPGEPKVCQVVNGYTYVGGNPKNPASWSKLRPGGEIVGTNVFQGGDPRNPDAWKPLTKRTMTADESKAATFADRMLEANKIMLDKGVDWEGTSLRGTTLENIGSSNWVPDALANALQTDRYQSYEQARRSFINAVLRKESGAVISPSEFESADKQYFPHPNDRESVVEQKRRERETAINGMVREAGPLYRNKQNSAQPQKKQKPAATSHPPDIEDILAKYRSWQP